MILRFSERAAIAAAGPNGAITFATIAREPGEHNTICCRRPDR